MLLQLTFFLRGSCMGTAAHNLPVQDDLWAVVEIYGQTESIRRLPVEVGCFRTVHVVQTPLS